MNYWENSIVYRILAGSWFLGWLVDAPGEISQHIKYSFSYRLADNFIKLVQKLLNRAGNSLKQHENKSLAVKNPLGFLGLLVFFYFASDLVINDYGLKRTIIEIALAAAGILLTLLKIVPGIWTGSIMYRFFAWWTRTD